MRVKNTCVLAGAGSGKTTYLVDRFVDAVIKEKIDPLSILAVTFTDKAAIELKERLIRAFEEKGLLEERQKLEQAYIGTIHSFCARILRENPIEAGIDPNFQILGEGESEILMSRILDELFESEAENENWLSLLTDYSEEALRAAFWNLYDTYRSLGEEEALFKIYTSSKKEKEKWSSFLSQSEELINLLKEEKVSESEEQNLFALNEICKKLKTELSWKLVQDIDELLGCLNLRSKKIKEAVLDLKEEADAWIKEAVSILNEASKKEFLRMFFLFKERFESEKRMKAIYDFEDLLCLVSRLFKAASPKESAVRRFYQNHFNLIFVDEYQDTSFLQHEIIFSLRRKDNLLVVGDLQQSIYGFRHAEPELFLGISQKPDFEKVELRKNYRSRHEILEFINKTFENKEENPFFENLIPARNIFVSKNAVQIIAVEKDGEKVPNLEKARLIEAFLIAKAVQEKVKAKEFKYGDIAVLFKSTTALHFYEKAFQDAGIPYYAVKGKSFFEKPEILDVLSFLELIENPNLDVALACVLRSPFIGISDDSLFWLADFAKKNHKERPLIQGVYDAESINELSSGDKEKIFYLRSKIQQLEARKSRLRISEIIEKMLEDFHYEAKILTRPSGKQKFANVQKLLEMSRSLEEKGIFSIQEFVNYLKRMSEEGALEMEAKIQGLDQNTVKLFTVHASKGLEFPCVFVADMGQEPKKNTKGSFTFSKKHGFGLKTKNPISSEAYEDASFGASHLEWLSHQSAEDARLLYVAMTRAKDQLVLAGCDNANSWMGKILKKHSSEKINNIEIPKDHSRKDFLREEVVFSFSNEALEDLLRRLRLPSKTYDHYDDLTVTDLLAANSAEPEYLEEEEILLEDDKEAPRNEYGTIFHKIMEYLVKEKPKTLSLKASFWKIAHALSKTQQKELQESVVTFWKSSLAKEIRQAKRVYPELPFIYRTKHGILKGQIDLIYEKTKNDWVVLDYKTNKLLGQTKKELTEHYKFQLAVYALIFKKLYGQTPKKGILYFSFSNELSEILYEKFCFETFEKDLERRFKEVAF